MSKKCRSIRESILREAKVEEGEIVIPKNLYFHVVKCEECSDFVKRMNRIISVLRCKNREKSTTSIYKLKKKIIKIIRNTKVIVYSKYE